MVFGTVVGNVFDDGEARSAVGAVDEGITIAAVSWGRSSSRRQSGQMETSGEMGWKAPSTDSEWRMSKEVNPLAGRKEAENSSMRESVGASSRNFWTNKSRASCSPSTSIFNACGGILHPAFEFEARGKVINKGSEADPLHNACDVNAQCLA